MGSLLAQLRYFVGTKFNQVTKVYLPKGFNRNNLHNEIKL